MPSTRIPPARGPFGPPAVEHWYSRDDIYREFEVIHYTDYDSDEDVPEAELEEEPEGNLEGESERESEGESSRGSEGESEEYTDSNMSDDSSNASGGGLPYVGVDAFFVDAGLGAVSSSGKLIF